MTVHENVARTTKTYYVKKGPSRYAVDFEVVPRHPATTNHRTFIVRTPHTGGQSYKLAQNSALRSSSVHTPPIIKNKSCNCPPSTTVFHRLFLRRFACLCSSVNASISSSTNLVILSISRLDEDVPVPCITSEPRASLVRNTCSLSGAVSCQC